MHARLSRWLAVAALCTLGASTAAAQAQAPAPQVSVGGLVYTQFVYQLKDSLNHVNNFDVTRAYVNVIGRFAGGLYTRVTADIYRNTAASSNGSLSYRLKYAYAAYTPAGSKLTYKVGQIHTAWLDWEEALWDYRVQGSMPMERGFMTAAGAQNPYVSSSDFGIGVDGRWGPDKINMQVVVVNGENYNTSPGDKGKDAQARLSFRLKNTNDSSRVGGLRLTGYAQYGKSTGGGQRNRFIGMLSYRTRQITLAAEGAATQDWPTGGVAVNGRVYSAYGVYKFTGSKAAALARVDMYDPQAGVDDKQTRFIAGLSYQLTPNWRLLADVDNLSITGTPTPAQEAVRSQFYFQTQINF